MTTTKQLVAIASDIAIATAATAAWAKDHDKKGEKSEKSESDGKYCAASWPANGNWTNPFPLKPCK